MNKNEIQSVIALLDNADKQVEGLTPKKANALLICICEDAVGALREALTKQPAQQQEPAAIYVGETWCGSVVRLYADLPLDAPLYTSQQPSKPWVGLTDEDIGAVCGFGEHTTASTRFTLMTISRAIEAKLKEKNT